MTVLSFTNLRFFFDNVNGQYWLHGDRNATEEISITRTTLTIDDMVANDSIFYNPTVGGPSNTPGAMIANFYKAQLGDSKISGHSIMVETTYNVSSNGSVETVQIHATLFTEEEKKNLLLLGGAIIGIAIVAYLGMKK